MKNLVNKYQQQKLRRISPNKVHEKGSINIIKKRRAEGLTGKVPITPGPASIATNTAKASVFGFSKWFSRAQDF